AIIDGEEETGVTIMQMDKGLDTGDMLLSVSVPIERSDTADTLHDRLSVAGSELIIAALKKIESGTIIPVQQNDDLSCYAPMLTKEEGNIDWQLPARSIERLVRGLNSWPSAYTFYQDKVMKIWSADPLGSEDLTLSEPLSCASLPTSSEQLDRSLGKAVDALKPGMIAQVNKGDFVVKTGEGYLRINELQLEGKKRMTTADFLRGVKMIVGTELSAKRISKVSKNAT
ncbi:MAG: hypothetical protein LBV33_05815, partial [Lachnospiraceae bacterium]|nr:hypothetical protein [Lachnospiraceae bacterium]